VVRLVAQEVSNQGWWPDSVDRGRRKRFVEERERLEGEKREPRRLLGRQLVKSSGNRW